MNILKLHFTKHKRPWRPLLLQLCYNFINKLLPTTREITKISPRGLYFSKAFFEGLIFGGAYVQREIWISKSIGLACCGKEIYHFCFVLLCIREQIPCTSPLGGLYSEGRFNGGFFALRFWGAYIWRGLFSEFYSMLTLWSSQIPLRRMIGYFFFLLCEGQHSSLSGQKLSYMLYFIFSEAGVPSHTKLLHLSVDYAGDGHQVKSWFWCVHFHWVVTVEFFVKTDRTSRCVLVA